MGLRVCEQKEEVTSPSDSRFSWAQWKRRRGMGSSDRMWSTCTYVLIHLIPVGERDNGERKETEMWDECYALYHSCISRGFQLPKIHTLILQCQTVQADKQADHSVKSLWKWDKLKHSYILPWLFYFYLGLFKEKFIFYVLKLSPVHPKLKSDNTK